MGKVLDVNFQFLGMDFCHYVVWFFVYSFLGWCMECCVIRKQLGYWENRGFSKAPFCVIYGLGTTIATALFTPIKNNLIALYIFGALAATMFEYLTALLMLKLFGKLWWDYSHLKYNYKGMLCVESTLGWGCLAVFIIGFLNDILIRWILMMPAHIAFIISTALVLEYIIDFSINFYKSFSARLDAKEQETQLYKENSN